MNIQEISRLKNLLEEFIEDCDKQDKPLMLYGAGSYCDWGLRLLEKYRMSPRYIVDRRGGGVKNNIPVITLEEAEKMYRETSFRILIVTPMYAEEVKEELRKFMSEEDIYAFECELYYSFIHDLDEYRRYLREHEEELKGFYDELKDEVSRDTLENVLKGRVSGGLNWFRECRKPDQYYIDELFDCNMQGVFLDVGASVGDTLEALAEKTNNSFKKVYCFEPSRDAYVILQEKAKPFGSRVKLVNKGAWDSQEILTFHEDAEHGASKLSEEDGDNIVEVVVDALDHMVDQNDKVVHIKMDIEGAEKRALKGAERIIRRDKPMLAICVYHRNDDFLEISKLIREIVPEYKFYLRHHNVAGTETVLYAVV